jgi:hypothetical protein
MHIRWLAVAGAMALATTPALAACSTAPAHPAGGTPSDGAGTPGEPAAAPGERLVPDASPSWSLLGPSGSAISDADLARIDQGLSDATNALIGADQDAIHDESGDSAP